MRLERPSREKSVAVVPRGAGPLQASGRNATLSITSDVDSLVLTRPGSPARSAAVVVRCLVGLGFIAYGFCAAADTTQFR